MYNYFLTVTFVAHVALSVEAERFVGTAQFIAPELVSSNETSRRHARSFPQRMSAYSFLDSLALTSGPLAV